MAPARLGAHGFGGGGGWEGEGFNGGGDGGVSGRYDTFSLGAWFEQHTGTTCETHMYI